MGSIDDTTFLRNLALTCHSPKGVITEDGKKRSYAQAIKDNWKGITRKRHFQACLSRLNILIDSDCYKALTIDQQLDIYHRMSAIALKKKLTKPDSKAVDFPKLTSVLVERIFRSNVLVERIFRSKNPYLKNDIQLIKESISTKKGENFIADYETFITFLGPLIPKNKVISQRISLIYEMFDELIKEKIKEAKPEDRDFLLLQNGALHFYQEVQKHAYLDQYKFKKLLNGYNKLINNKLIPANRIQKIALSETSFFSFARSVDESKEFYSQTPKSAIRSYLSSLESLWHCDVDLVRDHFAKIEAILNEAKNDETTAFALRLIDDLLSRNVCGKGVYVSEENDLARTIAEPLFAFINTHICKADRNLSLSLKLKLANLPCVERENYKELILTQEDQKDVLILHLKKEEINTLLSITQELKKKTFYLPNILEAKYLAKLLADKSPLGNIHLNELRRAVEKRLENISIDWNRTDQLKETLYLAFKEKKSKSVTHEFKTFTYVAKTLRELTEEEIEIPFWYHATQKDSADSILTSKCIEVRHSRRYKGAWISTRPLCRENESYYGSYVFAFPSAITELNLELKIGYTFDNMRWRGLQTPIEFEKKNHGVSFIACPKKDKKKFREKIKEANMKVKKVMSLDRLCFIHSTIQSCLGLPNLKLEWWGKNEKEPLPST